MTEPRYLSTTGYPTTNTDANRALWYGPCGYWTDDWSLLDSAGGIPCCPVCGSPGFQSDWFNWNAGAAKFQSDGNPGYVNFVADTKETCRGGRTNVLEEFKQWLREHPNGRVTPSPRSAGD